MPNKEKEEQGGGGGGGGEGAGGGGGRERERERGRERRGKDIIYQTSATYIQSPIRQGEVEIVGIQTRLTLPYTLTQIQEIIAHALLNGHLFLQHSLHHSLYCTSYNKINEH